MKSYLLMLQFVILFSIQIESKQAGAPPAKIGHMTWVITHIYSQLNDEQKNASGN